MIITVTLQEAIALTGPPTAAEGTASVAWLNSHIQARLTTARLPPAVKSRIGSIGGTITQDLRLMVLENGRLWLREHGLYEVGSSFVCFFASITSPIDFTPSRECRRGHRVEAALY